MSDNNDYSQEGAATIRKWQRMREKDQNDHDTAVEKMRRFMEEAIKKEPVRQKINNELKEIRHTNRFSWEKNKDTSGYNIMDDDYDPLVDGDGGFRD